jgi:GNAT superfamily N-acetyltransferase
MDVTGSGRLGVAVLGAIMAEVPDLEMTALRLRPALATDKPFLRELHHRVYREVVMRQFGAWDEAAQDGWFEKGLGEASFDVIELSGEAIGAVAVRETTDALHLVELQIAPDWQGQGIGSQVLALQLRHATGVCKPVELRVLLQNRARHLSERFGFRVLSQDATHYSMVWELERGTKG